MPATSAGHKKDVTAAWQLVKSRRVNLGDFRVANSKIFVHAWRLEAHMDNDDMMHHFRLCIEGSPFHRWNEYVTAFVISCKFSLDYIELVAPRHEDTRFLSPSAWTSNPNTIPKVKMLTLPAHGHRRRDRCDLPHRVLLHLDLLEDHSKARDNDDPLYMSSSSRGSLMRLTG
ncbi:hypothetical protein ZWY2020_002264 [Hordeum vulgare]|nr:hypothetical protein ZWY2020_002264 [Hordeum vulgare]